MKSPRLLADIGGTNMRLAWQERPDGPLHDTRVLPCAGYPTVHAAIAAYLAGAAIAAPHEAALGMANPVTGDLVRMTNHSWSFSQSALREALGLRRLIVVNDFTALALALPLLTPDLLRQVGGGVAVAGSAVALLGPGTGLGVSGLVFPPGAHSGVPLSGEGGHVSVAAQTPLEFEVLRILQARYGHVSAERAVCGAGLVDLYHALRQLGQSGAAGVDSAAQVSDLALQDGDPLALQALELFCGFLGNVAGNLALTLGALGGVYIGGGIVPRLGAWFDRSPFRARFEAKGRFQPYLAAIPCWVIDPGATPALYGAARALDIAGAQGR
ncbi:glucokinase [Verminephrobacter aporrectodeae]|uniref:Glucokinase n=1 Tax=Verminephrobacter aporrectodeae subsp. tuberculatae TaxID=1110392 RepID=A0ABT3KPN7_9BURK|nr:glucokinase [Verminephrobacter aporrectodeae]MCW5320278.1 glucokinase [Verminephrobacter aporrectodeae subsp. tuberculatae]MCW8164039.1 glucokinase [Verminephrobacter aporrectodeae subsp. tuberculatae]MCW8168184.1 glucokinase [Verminephrobacter aporrectodeae subsp. tuberculatae]MCW8174865.1 glucokinase [Verminephrobacter aporrectodeae subsp. tuberculatae]MCW8197499.1 glucokinase [Verminephrobacter aporrectodeae subsp. tuberculatae]